MDLILTVSIFALLFYVYTSVLGPVFYRKFHRFPPSPLLCFPVIGHLYLFKRPLYRSLASISQKHGPVVLLQVGCRRVVVVSSNTAVEDCLKRNDVVFANRPQLLTGKILGYGSTTLPWVNYGEHWRNLRRIVSLEILSTHRIQMFSDVRRNEVRYLVRRLWNRRGDTGEFVEVELKSALFELALNNLMMMIGGKRYSDDGDETASLEERTELKEVIHEGMAHTGAKVVDFLPFLLSIGMDKIREKLELLHRRRDSLLQNLIDEHKRSPKSQTLIGTLLSLKETDSDCYSNNFMKGMMQSMLSAGTDSSAVTMEWAMTLLLNNPETLTKAQNEIAAVTGNSRLIEESDLPNLPYLRSIIFETLRICPVAPLIPHESSADCFVLNHRVTKGTILIVNAWAIHNDPKWWDEPRTFKPERFLEDDGGKREGIVMLPFGYGRRGCPGENLAMHVVGLTMGALIQCFEWRRVGEEMVDMAESRSSGLTVPKLVPLVAKFRPRKEFAQLLSTL